MGASTRPVDEDDGRGRMINLFAVRPRGFNIGNEAIFTATRRLLHDAFDDAVNIVPVPAVESSEEGSLAGFTPMTLYEMNLYGHGVVLGGGNLYENGQLAVDVHGLRRLRPPLLLFGVSWGRIYDDRARLVERTDSMRDDVIVALNDVAAYSLARDDATLAHLRSIGVDTAVLGGCPTILLAELARPPVIDRHDEDPGTLVAVRHPRQMSVPLHEQARLHDDLRSLVATLEAEGFGPVRLLCNDRRDLAFAASFESIEYVLPDDVHSYLELLRCARLVVTFRLHAFVPCLSFGTPAVNISYDERSLSLVRTLGLEPWDIDLVRDPDLVGAVRDRCRRLDDLETLRKEAEPTWKRLGDTMRTAIADFASDVRRYVAEGDGRR